MTIEATATAIHTCIREFYKAGVKSANKVYADYSEYEMLAKSRPASFNADKKRPVLSEEDYLEKQADRAEGINGTRKSYWKDIQKALPGKSIAEYGKFLYEEQKKKTQRAGNCMEMTAIAIHLVKDTGYTGWLCFVKEDDIDHAFCAITAGRDSKPGWKSIAQMDQDGSAAWIVDPWANVCCPAKNYRSSMIKKFEKWHYSGKLILTKVTYDKYGREDYQYKSPGDFAYQRDFWAAALAVEADTYVAVKLNK